MGIGSPPRKACQFGEKRPGQGALGESIPSQGAQMPRPLFGDSRPRATVWVFTFGLCLLLGACSGWCPSRLPHKGHVTNLARCAL